ncbi:MAG TPA: hypothetical protein EYN91_23925 [Candidatus Melainabacteria bacterium]|nr:hypothetical protein [Candidatus Melainabacteria bacterium]HIN66761.1 hypothetical protein [Candidatus Obscuribacterales bacterium]
MILEAFAEYLHAADQSLPATEVLSRWIKERLDAPVLTNVDRVVHCEISIAKVTNKEDCKEQSGKKLAFKGNSKSGRQLLKSLFEYCQSYEQQKWARYVHNLKASDFRAGELRDSN